MSGHDGTTIESLVREYKAARWRFFRYRSQTDLATKTALALGFAALTGLAAQVRIPLPFTPVPITLQTFAVLLAGVVLGMRFGGLSQAVYVGTGLAGVPWFQGGGAGLGHLLGPTGGYLLGFVAAAAAIGYVIDRYPVARRLPALLVVLLVANFGIIYGIGLPWLFGWLHLIAGSPVTLVDGLAMGLFPFIPGDLVKLVAALAIGRAIIPQEAYGLELSAGRAGSDID